MHEAHKNKQLVLIGGGHTHALLLHSLAANPIANLDITVVDPAASAAYSGMLPGFIAGHYTQDELSIDLERLCKRAGARFIQQAATGLLPQTREVMLEEQSTLGFDIASIDIGITSALTGLPGFELHGVAAKPLGHFARAWQAFLSEIHSGKRAANIGIIGGGVAGVELALAMAHALRAHAQKSIHIIDRSAALQHLNPKSVSTLQKALKDNKINVLEHSHISSIAADQILLEKGEPLEAAFVVSAAGARPYPWLGASGLKTRDGFLSVGPDLQTSCEGIFAVGDCAHLSHDPRPKAGVFAVRQAPTLQENIRRFAADEGKSLSAFWPQKDYLKLISLGPKLAIGERGARSYAAGLGQRLAWRIKDRIDQKFMQNFQK